MIHHGDCLEVMAGMEPESVDAICTDPPYGLEFMGKEWDKLDAGLPQENVWKGRRGQGGAKVGDDDSKPASRHHVSFGGERQGFKRCVTCGKRAFSGSPCKCTDPVWVIEYNTGPPSSAVRMQRWHQQWAEAAYRVAKPSAYLLAFGGTRTVHRMTVALEDAGWIIRDMLVWAYASGFPKSKASLKPAWEPIVMARKPGPLRMLAIDECRIPAAADDLAGWHAGYDGRKFVGNVYGESDTTGTGKKDPAGRWPANVILTDPIFDGDTEGVVGGGETSSGALDRSRITAANLTYGSAPAERVGTYEPNEGTYSRFFILPKADRKDREPTLGLTFCGGENCRLDGCPWCYELGCSHHAPLRPEDEVRIESAHSTICAKCGRQRVNVPGAACKCPDPEWVRKAQTARRNHHPTVKPTELMRHLVRLVTPSGGTVLDPFLGSGTTGIAAELEGFSWIGIEKEAEYVAIAEARLNGTQRGLGLSA